MSEPRTDQRWMYRTTWVREWEEGDEKLVDEHLDRWAEEGWELVTANALHMLLVETDWKLPYVGAAPPYARTYSTGVVRHYFYWRKAVNR